MSKRDSAVRLFNLAALLIALAAGCNSTGKQKNEEMKDDFKRGSFGYDRAFFAGKGIGTVELRDSAGKASLLIVPAYQGRVMTSSVSGDSGMSFGWINYRHIESGSINSQFNPFGGEERLWLGPEGGPFSIYFAEGKEQLFSNWQVPKDLDTEPFEIIYRSSAEVSFRKEFEITNASGNRFQVGITRTVRLLNLKKTQESLGIEPDPSLSYVAYESENILVNKGATGWSEENGALSIWMLSMFNPSPDGVVFIPFRPGSVDEMGPVVNDDYFGKVPDERLVIKDNIIFFRVDGRYRSKIGITPARALPMCGSYDPSNGVLTLLWYSSPDKPSLYVNSKWGTQDSPYSGDVVNSYNDGPVEDGSVMGPFYEIESSSPAAFLAPGEKITHIQRIFHFSGNEVQLSKLTEKLFGISTDEIVSAFKK